MSYVNGDALVETSWLADHLNDPNVRILDATFHLPTANRDAEKEFSNRHIPGAMLFDIEDIGDHDSPLPHMLPSAEQFAKQVSVLGIGNLHKVVVYDVYGINSAPRAWWMFRAFGHENVAVLNGGFPKWLAENRPTTDDMTEPKRESFAARFKPDFVRNIDDIFANLETKSAQVLDARAAGRFKGIDPEPRAGLRNGHMPGALSVPFTDLINGSNKTVKPADELNQVFKTAGVDQSGQIITTCGSGVTACVLSFGLHLLGKSDAAVYDGSWTEWGGREDTPIETG